MNAAFPPALWTGTEVLAAIDGQGRADFSADGVAFDSRTLSPGDLFVAVASAEPGGRDGHDFVADALARGASAAIVSRMPPGLDAAAPLLWVADTGAALLALGQAARARFHGTAFAVTGSVGKTSTKQALAQVLGGFGPTHASPKSFNNALGVPITLATAPRGTRFMAIEIGMNQPGEIAPLARLAQPHVAIVTTVDAVHIGHLGSVAKIAAEKADIFQGLAANPSGGGGTAVVPADNAHVGLLMRRAEDFGADRILTFGERPSHAQLVGFRPDAEGSDVVADVLGRRIRFRLGAPGKHLALNALAVLAAMAGGGLDPVAAAERFEGFSPMEGRGARRTIATGSGQALLLDESYNASVPSVRAALAVLALQPARRRVAVLGDMLEMGAHGPAMHYELAETVAEAADLVFTCGLLMAELFRALPSEKQGAHATTAEALAPLVRARLRDGDAVMVKGSLGMRMAAIVRALAGDISGSGGSGIGGAA